MIKSALQEVQRTRFIPVTERVPTHDKIVIIFNDDESWMCAGRYTSRPLFGETERRWFDQYDDEKEDAIVQHVTHWMELPGDPMEEGGQKE